MMKYRNTKTGAVVETACNVTGKNWEPIKPAKPAPKKEPVTEAPKPAAAKPAAKQGKK